MLDVVHELNLVNVDFDSIYEAFAALGAMPALTYLNINLEGPQEVEDALKALPELKELNGISGEEVS
jgi:hypothetical protein